MDYLILLKNNSQLLKPIENNCVIFAQTNSK